MIELFVALAVGLMAFVAGARYGSARYRKRWLSAVAVIRAQDDAMEAEHAQLEIAAYQGNHQAGLKAAADAAYRRMVEERAGFEARADKSAIKTALKTLNRAYGRLR